MTPSDQLVIALGLKDVTIETTKFHDESLTCFIECRQVRAACVCTQCHGPLIDVHSWISREFRGPPLGIYKTVKIKLWRLRGTCSACDKVRQSAIPFAHPEFESLTWGAFEVAGRLMEETTCEATARILNLNSKLMWRVDQWRMRQMLKIMDLKTMALSLKYLSVDEVHFLSRKPEIRKAFSNKTIPEFITNLVSQDMRRVLWNFPGRDEEALDQCFSRLTPEQLEEVLCVAADMNDAYWLSIRKNCPKAAIAVDRYHLVENLNKAFDQVRQEEFQKARSQKDEFMQEVLKPQNRFILVQRTNKKPRPWMETKMLDQLRSVNVNIQNAMLCLEYFHLILDKRKIGEFQTTLLQWYRLVRESKLKPLIKFANLVRHYRLSIETYIFTRLTTAVSEGINNKIKVLRRVAYQYSNRKSYRLKILQRCGLLNSQFIDTDPWLFGHWHKAALR